MKILQTPCEWPPYAFPSLTNFFWCLTNFFWSKKLTGERLLVPVSWELGRDWLPAIVIGSCIEMNMSIVTIAIAWKLCRKVPLQSPGRSTVASGSVPLSDWAGWSWLWVSTTAHAPTPKYPTAIKQLIAVGSRKHVCFSGSWEDELLGSNAQCPLGMKNWSIWGKNQDEIFEHLPFLQYNRSHFQF